MTDKLNTDNQAAPAAASDAPEAISPRPAKAKLRIDFGRRWLAGQEAALLDAGSVVILEAAAQEPVNVYVNGRLFARGEAVEVNGRIGVRVSEILACPAKRACGLEACMANR